MQFSLSWENIFFGWLFFLVCFPFIYICLLFTRQVFNRTSPSLIEDVGFLKKKLWEILIIIILPQKINLLPRKGPIFFFNCPICWASIGGKHIPSHPISQTKPKKKIPTYNLPTSLFCGAKILVFFCGVCEGSAWHYGI